MNSHRIVHVALRVESLGQAEHFYARLFELQVQPDAGSAGHANPPSRHRPNNRDATATDGTVTERTLGKGPFRLVLTREGPMPVGAGRLAGICLLVTPSSLAGVRARAESLGCHVLSAAEDRLVLEDVYGVQWQVMAEPPEH